MAHSPTLSEESMEEYNNDRVESETNLRNSRYAEWDESSRSKESRELNINGSSQPIARGSKTRIPLMGIGALGLIIVRTS